MTTAILAETGERAGAKALAAGRVAPALALAAAAGGGLLYAASLPPLAFAACAWIALVPLLLAAVRSAPSVAGAAGLVWGVCFGLASAHWLPAMLADYFEVSASAGALGLLSTVVFFAGLHVALFAAWLSWAARRHPVSPLLVGAAWATCELVRAHLPIANPWALSALSQIEWSGLVQAADLAGPFGLGALIGLVNATVAALVEPRLRPGRRLRQVALAAAVLAAVLGYGALRQAQAWDSGEALPVAVLQGGAPLRYGADPQPGAERLERYLALADRAAASGPALVLWPEGALDFSPLDLTARSLRLRRASRRARADWLVGGVRFDDAAGRRHNALFQLRRGSVRGHYDKIALMPFAESNPWKPLPAPGRDGVAPGHEIRMFETAGLSLGSLICSEAMLPGFARRVGGAGAEVLLNPSNDSWFPDEGAARLQLAASRLRAIENRRYVIRAASTGYSAVIDPRGRVLARSGLGDDEWIAGEVHGISHTTPYQRLGDAPCWALAGIVVIASVRRRGAGPLACSRFRGASPQLKEELHE